MIEEILKKEEGKTLEFKENLQSLSGIVKTVIAFANTAGGQLVIGIEDKTKKIVGIKDAVAEEERLASVINDSIHPQLMPDIITYAYRNKSLIVINVYHGSGPYFLKSAGIEKGAYVRLGSTNRVADTETLQTLKNLSRNIAFDELPDIQGKLTDIDWDFIKELFNRVNKKITAHNAESIGLVTKHGTKELPSYGGIILFGKDRLKMFPEAIIRCARFAGIKRAEIIDQLTIELYLPIAIDEAIKFIQRNTSLRSEIKSLAPRVDIPQYPPLAVREALINAIVHADYSIKGVYISVAIFDDRIEITNPGSLPFGFTLEKAMAGASKIRNRVIAKTFYHLRWIEQWGRGLQLIIDECVQRGLNEPKFEEINNQFRVTLYATIKSKIELKDWQQEFINYLKEHKSVSTQEAAVFWLVTTRTARTRLLRLIDLGLITMIGTSSRDPKGRYVLSE